MRTAAHRAPAGRAEVEALAERLSGAWGCWAPTLSGDGRRMAFVSDRSGVPELWAQDLRSPGRHRVLPLSGDPVLAAHWSADGQWLACALATGGGVRTEVWVLRPDGSGARRLAGGDRHVVLGRWSRRGHRLLMTLCGDGAAEPNHAVLVDPDDGRSETVARGALAEVVDLSADGRFALLRDGPRGAQFCRLLDRRLDVDHAVLPEAAGSTPLGLLRPSPAGEAAPTVAYLASDAGRALRALIAVPFGPDGVRGGAGVLAARADAELELADADDAGRCVLLVWNVGGRSEVEVLDTVDRSRRRLDGLPGAVVSDVVLARNGRRAVLAVESPHAPRRLWALDMAGGGWSPLTHDVLDTPDARPLVSPELHHFASHDGLEISGFLYRPVTNVGSVSPPSERPPVVISLHGGPEGQERPVFNPQHQVLAAAGMLVFAPNIRGSSGAGRAFEHADDRFGRIDAIEDVVASADYLCSLEAADPARVAVSGRSYGGYATLMALTRHPGRFAAGVDVCGMSDLLTFYGTTEPWIARAAVTKYGDPDADRELLAALSPLRQIARLRAPLLVVHGELDTNVPVTEGRQLVEAVRALGRPVEYLELPGEGHEYRRAASRLELLRSVTAFLARAFWPDDPGWSAAADGRGPRRAGPRELAAGS